MKRLILACRDANDWLESMEHPWQAWTLCENGFWLEWIFKRLPAWESWHLLSGWYQDKFSCACAYWNKLVRIKAVSYTEPTDAEHYEFDSQIKVIKSEYAEAMRTMFSFADVVERWERVRDQLEREPGTVARWFDF